MRPVVRGKDRLAIAGDLPPGKWTGPYLEKQQLPVDPWNNPFVYQEIDRANGKFQIYSLGPNMQDEQGSGDDIATAL
jgi:general secretion pathway protein G